jgi:protein SCO1/2
MATIATEPDRLAGESAAGTPAAGRPASGVPLVMVLLWGLLGVVILGLVMAGVWTFRGARREPLPVIAEVPAFSLVDRDGSVVTGADFAGAPWIADFIFTRCVAFCPRMTLEMSRVAEALPAGSPVEIASISVDPEHDTPEVLSAYAEQHGAGENWHFLTGEVGAIESLAREGFLLAVDRSPPPGAGPGPIVHSNRFVLVDGEGRIRGYYDSFDRAEMDRLLGDVRTLLRER